MSPWIPVARADEIRKGAGRRVLAGGREIAVFRNGDRWHAMDDTCPHQGASLGDGLLHDGKVVCPWHAWSFDALTGTCVNVPEIGVAIYPVRCRDGAVEVDLPETGGPETPPTERSER